jgi:hypothetical protein
MEGTMYQGLEDNRVVAVKELKVTAKNKATIWFGVLCLVFFVAAIAYFSVSWEKRPEVYLTCNPEEPVPERDPWEPAPPPPPPKLKPSTPTSACSSNSSHFCRHYEGALLPPSSHGKNRLFFE